MLRRPPGEGRRSSPPQKLVLLAFAFILLPWLQAVDAQQQPGRPVNTDQPPVAAKHAIPAAHASASYVQPDGSGQKLDDEAPAQNWASTPARAAADDYQETSEKKRRPISSQLRQAQHNQGDTTPDRSTRNLRKRTEAYGQHAHGNRNKKTQTKTHTNYNIKHDDESALATLAPAQAVRAPHPPRHHKPSSTIASGLASPQIARSLEDWEVEDFVLLATVDGDLYATDRKTGQERWHLEVDQPMVETKHYRTDSSALEGEYNPVDHYIWAVEPNKDGGLYVWAPDSDLGLVPTGLSMKSLVEQVSPHFGINPAVVYTGDKKTTMVTLDAATGRVLKWFGSSGSHVNEAESCLRPNTLYDRDNGECSSTGTITLGRIEYTVGIQRRDGRPIATLKYSEWGPNNFNNDLYQQHHISLDSRYVTSHPDGKVYAFDYDRSEKAALYSHKLVSPVARVFDVCRPWDAPADSSPELVVLPQPAMPSKDENMDRMRRNSIFLNQTEAGSWYALSGRAYPLIIDAPIAEIARPEWAGGPMPWDFTSEPKHFRALVGTHFLEPFYESGKQAPSLPAGAAPGNYEEADHEVDLPDIAEAADEPTIITKVKSLPQSAANSVIDFISNPILIILFVGALIYNEKKLRRSYHRLRTKGLLKEAMLYFNPKSFIEHYEEPDEKEKVMEDPVVAVEEHAGEHAKEEEEVMEVKPEDQDIDGDVITTLPKAPAATETIPEDQPLEIKPPETDQAEPSETNLGTPVKKEKKARRGRRGGVKHRKNGKPREGSQSRDDEPAPSTVEEAVSIAKKLGDRPSLEPDVQTINRDMQAVTGSTIRMGNIEVDTDLQLGTGSNGTLVFAGKFDGREVAVKRMLIQFYDIASQETRLLRESDDHPNVIRYYSQQIQDGFLYIALERCEASLADVVEKPDRFRQVANAGRQDLPAVLYQITNGISHLHSLRIVHRDLKPQNILVSMDKNGRPRMLVSDFGLCKKLEGGQSSFGATTGRAAGTSGWRAPELLLDDDARDAGVVEISTHSGSGSVLVNDNGMPGGRRATRAIDIFSLGLVFHYVLTNGSHPFDCGDKYMREVNIRKGDYDLRALDSLGDFAFEAKDLIASMLDADPKRRPQAHEVMSHPFFWSAKKRLAFLCDVSDHFEKEPREPPSDALCELERHAHEVTKGDFLRMLPRDFVDSMGKQRKYTGGRLLDLLRALRNKRNHYEDMPDSLRRTVGPLPEGYLAFWTVKFPSLLLVCWNVVYNVHWEETDRFRDYYEPAGL